MSAETYYQPLDDGVVFDIMQGLEEEFENYLHYGLGYNKGQYALCGVDVIDAIIRVHKRIEYYRYFHRMKINNEKKAALYAYWIAKLRPVKLTGDKLGVSKEHFYLNEKLAVHYFMCALVDAGKVKLWDGTDGIRGLEKTKLITELCYSFRFRNLTIDSMIILAESINTDSFKK